MSVLITGMGMPKHCWQCAFHDDVDECILLNQSCMVVWGESKRLEDCPLVEVPKHGRLIDADSMKTKIDGSDHHTIEVVKQWVDEQPTIIESEEIK